MTPVQHPASQSDERDLAYAVLVLERQLEAYQRLHEEDLAALRAALQEIKAQLVERAQRAAAASRSHDSGDSTQYHSS